MHEERSTGSLAACLVPALPTDATARAQAGAGEHRANPMRSLAFAVRCWLDGPLPRRIALVALAGWALLALGDIAAGAGEGMPAARDSIATAAVVLVSALLSSVVGFAFAAIAGCGLALLQADPVSAVRIIVLCSFAIQLYAVWKLRSSIHWRPLLLPLLGGVLALPFGVWLLVNLNRSWYAPALGVFLVAYAAYLLLFRERPLVAGEWTGALAGALGGLAGGLAGLPGVSMTIWCSMRGWDKQQQRAVYQPFILVMQLLTMVWLHGHAPLPARAASDLAFVPFALIGAVGGLAVYQRLAQQQFRFATAALLLVSGAGLLARAL